MGRTWHHICIRRPWHHHVLAMLALRRCCSRQTQPWHHPVHIGSSLRCSSSGNDSGKLQSDDFSSQLRRGFQPQPRRKQQQQSSNGVPPAMGGKVILGNNLTDDAWREVDKQVNKYPGYRTFTAIGTGGDEFKDAMVKAVEAVVGQKVHEECVQQRPSSKGSYVSVKVGPVVVHTPEQVIDIFANMKKDPRLKWYM